MKKLGLILLALSAARRAQAVETLSWDDCVKRTIENSSDLKSAESTRESSERLEGASRSGLFPQVAANVGYQKTDIPGSDSYTANFTASENLFAGFQDLGKIRQARFNSEAAGMTLQIAKARISYDLKSVFQNAIYAKEYANLTKDIIKRRQDDLRLVELSFQGGTENKGSVYLSQAYLAQAKLDDFQAEDSRRAAVKDLALVLGIDEFTDYNLQGQIPVSEPKAGNPDFKSLVATLPDYKQAVAQAQASDAAVTIARSQFYPTVNLTGTAGKGGPTFFPDENRWSFGLTLSVPLFNGGRDYYGTEAAIETRASLQAAQLNVSRQLLVKLDQAYSTYVEAVERLKVNDSFQHAALVRSDIARKKYNNGLMTYQDWDLIESDLINRQKAYLSSKRDRVIAEAAWQQALGQGVIP